MNDENVLVVPRSLIESIGMFDGLCFDIEPYLEAFWTPANNLFLPRSSAETDPSHKQIIPYVVLTHAGRIFHYVRGKKGGETRLHAKGSIGIGGHMNDGDMAALHFDRAAYETALAREIDEELILDTPYKQRVAGLLNDDSTEVGQVHLGIIHIFDCETDAVRPRETDITETSFLTREELVARIDSLETWSAICARNLNQLLG